MSPFGPFGRLGPTDRYILRMAVLCGMLLIACGALALGYLGQRHANEATHVASRANQAAADATRAVAGSCQFYRDLSSVPIAPTSTRALLVIIADARVAYETAECPVTRGVLPPPDSRVAPYIPPGYR